MVGNTEFQCTGTYTTDDSDAGVGSITFGITGTGSREGGDGSWSAGPLEPFPQINNKATVISVSALPDPSGPSDGVTIKVVVGTLDGGSASGSASVQIDGGGAHPVPISGGAGDFLAGNLTAGVHSLSATYTSDNGYAGGSATGTATAAYPTTTMVFGVPNPSAPGRACL
ncbi:MAG: hypothetical protein WDM84_01170 [Bauldia sp.]